MSKVIRVVICVVKQELYAALYTLVVDAWENALEAAYADLNAINSAVGLNYHLDACVLVVSGYNPHLRITSTILVYCLHAIEIGSVVRCRCCVLAHGKRPSIL